MGYAEGSKVPADRSRAEIEKTLIRYGADEFVYGWRSGRAVIGFKIEGRRVQIEIPFPDQSDPKFSRTATGRQRKRNAAIQAWEQETRRLWRAASLVIKAKLEAVESGISTIEHEFFADIVTPSGLTIGQALLPQMETIMQTGQVPSLLPESTREDKP